VSTAKLKQRAARLKVHPDVTADCVENYVLSLKLAELVTVDGDQVAHLVAADTKDPTPAVVQSDPEVSVESNDSVDEGSFLSDAEEAAVPLKTPNEQSMQNHRALFST
jgi:hypothetical protein